MSKTYKIIIQIFHNLHFCFSLLASVPQIHPKSYFPAFAPMYIDYDVLSTLSHCFQFLSSPSSSSTSFFKLKPIKPQLISIHLFYNVMPYISITMYTSMGLIKFLDNINTKLNNGLPRWLQW